MKKKERKQFLVLGLGRFGSAAAITLAQEGMDVLGIDSDMAVVEAHKDLLTDAVCANCMERDELEELGAADFDVAIVSIGQDFKISGTATMHLKEMGVPKVVVKAYDEFQGRMLTRLGADKVIFPERDMAVRIAHNLVADRIMDFIELSDEFSMVEMYPKTEWIGKSLKELNLRISEKVNIIAIRSEQKVNAMPDANTVIHENDRLLVVAQNL